MTTRRRAAFALAGSISLLTFLVYLPSLNNDFLYWDDNIYVFENPHIRALGPELLEWAFTRFYAHNWHPLTWISHAVDYAAWGLSPFGHHLTNVLLHAANVFLVVLLTEKLLSGWAGAQSARSPAPVSDRTTLVAAGVSGTLFGLHPIHVESVAWVSERKDLLCALFFLLAVISYANYANIAGKRFIHERGAGGPPAKQYVISVSLLALALLSKPMAVSLPFVLLILDFFPFKRVDSFARFLSSVVEKTPFFILSIASSLVTLAAQRAGGALTPSDEIPLAARLAMASRSLVVYLGKMILPLELVPYYPYPKQISLLSLDYLFPIAFAACITVLCLVLANRQMLWMSAWAYYIVTLAPVIGIVQVGRQAMADRYAYLPSLGPFLVTGLAAAWLCDRAGAATSRPRIGRAALAVPGILLIATLASLTVSQISVWKNSLVFWNYVIAKKPGEVPHAHNNRGNIFAEMGLLSRALEDYEVAIRLSPTYSDAYFGRGNVFAAMGRYQSALSDFDRAISLNPWRYEAYNNRGLALKEMGMPDRALREFETAIALSPSRYEAYGNRGLVLEEMNRTVEALESLDAAISLSRSNPVLYFNRGNVHRRERDDDRAAADYRAACDLGYAAGCDALDALRPRR